MSNTYPNYPGSSFPDEIDKLIRMSDLTPADIPLVNQYYEYFNSGNLESANSILLANPGLDTKFFNAAKFNKIIDSVLCMENFFVDNVQGYIDTKQGEFNAKVDAFIYKGVYSASEDYVPKNIVYYSGCSYVCRVACRGVTPVAGSTSANWGLIAQKGDQGIQGASGTGLAPRGIWVSGTQFYKDDCVASNNILWQAAANNIDSEPSESNSNWIKLLEINIQHEHSASDITSGVLGTNRGGTGLTSWGEDKILYASEANQLSQVSFPSEDGAFLRQGKTGAPYWTRPSDVLSAISGVNEQRVEAMIKDKADLINGKVSADQLPTIVAVWG